MICENCGKEHDGSFGSGRFCSRSCANSFSTKKNREEINRKVSLKLRIRLDQNCKKCGIPISRKTKSCLCKRCAAKNRYSYRYTNVTDVGELKRISYLDYRRSCKFKFSIRKYSKEFDIDLIRKFGWYSAKNHGNNLNGVTRDHMYSVMDGFKNNIDPSIISHPANCKLMIHPENSSKHDKSSITLEELKERIKIWDEKYGNPIEG